MGKAHVMGFELRRVFDLQEQRTCSKGESCLESVELYLEGSAVAVHRSTPASLMVIPDWHSAAFFSPNMNQNHKWNVESIPHPESNNNFRAGTKEFGAISNRGSLS